MSRTLSVVWACGFCASLALAAEPVGLPNPFYAMDTAFKRPGTTFDEQLDLVKELGYAGIAWHEEAPAALKATIDAVAKRGLKFFTIYCAAKVTPEGELTHSDQLPAVMETLRGQNTIVWLHIGGKGPAFDSLTGNEPLVASLRKLADAAKANSLSVAIYPHLGEWTARFGDATKLAKIVNRPNFGVTFTLCHTMAAGDEAKIPELLEEAKGLLSNVQISGADAGVSGGKWAQLIQTLDRGTYDVGIVLRKLKQMGFTGPIGFQGFAIKGDAKSILVPTMEGYRKLSAAATK